jgi:hypothetical protein
VIPHWLDPPWLDPLCLLHPALLRAIGDLPGQAPGSAGALGLGVRARLPFRVFTLDGPGSMSRLVIDVAHHW